MTGEQGLDKSGNRTTIPFGKGEPSPTYSEQLAALHLVVEGRRVARFNEGIVLEISERDHVGQRSRAETLADDLPNAERRLGLTRESLSVNSIDTPIGLGGYGQPLERVDCVEAVIGRYEQNPDPDMYCATCDEHYRSKSWRDAVRWFRTHEPCPKYGEPRVYYDPETGETYYDEPEAA